MRDVAWGVINFGCWWRLVYLAFIVIVLQTADKGLQARVDNGENGLERLAYAQKLNLDRYEIALLCLFDGDC